MNFILGCSLLVNFIFASNELIKKFNNHKKNKNTI